MENMIMAKVEVALERVIEKKVKPEQEEAPVPPKGTPCGPTKKKRKRKMAYKHHRCIKCGSICITQQVERSINNHSVSMHGPILNIKPLRTDFPHNTNASDRASGV